MSNDTFFAAFIMTYNRVSTLEDTIKKIFSQSFPPHKVIIIDNDYNFSAKGIQNKYPEYNISYHPIGYNSGPAGAAKVGLEILVKEGYQWIAWMDDDDPPIFENTFEILLNMASSNEKCGCVGAVGQYFDKKNGLMIRVSDSELNTKGILSVDNIAGGMCKIVNANVCLKENIYPDESLFYGFEELDFDIRLQNSGYLLLTDRQLYKKHRIHFNRTDLNRIRGGKKELARLWREYYSTRNSLIILFKNKYLLALCLSLVRYSSKILFGFRYGCQYGILNAKFIGKGIFHFFFGKRGAYNI
jgi:GT2 family glycosyltransferase